MATKKLELYKCEVCTNIVEVMHKGASKLVCCNKPMILIEDNVVEASVEKHIPVIEKIDNGYKIKVGEAEHPMIDTHYIEWIELIADEKVYTKFLNPNDKPEAIFNISASKVTARAYCNLHGNWKSTI